MSNENEVTKALEDIKGEVNTAIDLKASTETVEANKKASDKVIADLNTKMDKDAEVSKTLADAQETKMAELEAKFAVLPVQIKAEAPVEMVLKQDPLVHNKSSLVLDITKAGFTDNTAVTGSGVSSSSIIHLLTQANPFRNYGTVITTGSGSIKLPQLQINAFLSEAAVAAKTVNTTISSTTVVVENWVGQNELSKPAAADIEGIDNVMMSLMTQEAGTAEAGDAVAVLAAGGYTAVNTGLAAALPASTAIVAKLADMAQELGSAYSPNAKWYLSREVLSLVRKSNDTVLNFDASQGLFTIFGYPVVIIDQIDDGATAGENSAYFGDMSRGLAVVSRKDLEISRFMETTPGSITYFGDLRSKASAWDLTALVALNSAV